MLGFTTAAKSSLDAFLSVSAASRYQKQLRDYTESLLRQEHRGRGVAMLLVRRGTERLVEDGATEIRGDCDRDNVGMVKGFERAGYEQFARRRTYQRSIR